MLEKMRSLSPYATACVCVPRDSCTRSLCLSSAILMHMSYARLMRYSPTSKKVSYTQDLLPNYSNHDLGIPKYGLWKRGGYDSLSL